MTKFEVTALILFSLLIVVIGASFLFELYSIHEAQVKIDEMHAKMFKIRVKMDEIGARMISPTDSQPPNTMTAQELIELLLRDPQARVVVQVGDNAPAALLDNQISLNNEAHAWVIWEPEP